MIDLIRHFGRKKKQKNSNKNVLLLTHCASPTFFTSFLVFRHFPRLSTWGRNVRQRSKQNSRHLKKTTTTTTELNLDLSRHHKYSIFHSCTILVVQKRFNNFNFTIKLLNFIVFLKKPGPYLAGAWWIQ